MDDQLISTPLAGPYSGGQYYTLHTDSQLAGALGGSRAKEYQLRGGLERHVSMLLYLNTVKPSDGGGTAFPAANQVLSHTRLLGFSLSLSLSLSLSVCLSLSLSLRHSVTLSLSPSLTIAPPTLTAGQRSEGATRAVGSSSAWDIAELLGARNRRCGDAQTGQAADVEELRERRAGGALLFYPPPPPHLPSLWFSVLLYLSPLLCNQSTPPSRFASA